HGPEEGCEGADRKFSSMLVARESLFLMIADENRTTPTDHLYERHARVVHAGTINAGEIDGLAAVKLGPDSVQSFGGEIAIKAMDRAASEEPLQQRSRRSIAGISEPLMPRFYCRHPRARSRNIMRFDGSV